MQSDSSTGNSPAGPALLAVLGVARERGFLGPGSLTGHVHHAECLGRIAEQALGPATPPDEFCDLGAGGGIPGLVLALRWPEARVALVEAGRRRCELLRDAVESLGMDGRVEVVEGRGELVARDEEMRERFRLVVARSFARPAATAEIATGFIAVGGVLMVSEPPAGSDESRWCSAGLAELGLGSAVVFQMDGVTAAVMRKEAATDERWPRRVGVPAKRAIW